MKVALVYDWVNKLGGAERVLQVMHEVWPDAPLYTAVYEPQGALWARKFKVISSLAQKFPLASRHHEFYPWLMPFAFESFDFSNFDVVISVTSSEAKGILTKPETLHICYCLTPTRYLYSHKQEYLNNLPLKFISKTLVVKIFSYLRKWDMMAAERPDFYVAISKTVQERIKRYYKKNAEVIYPPIDINFFNKGNISRTLLVRNFFLIVSRLVSYKKINLAVAVFNELGWPLKIVGIGNEMKRLKKLAKKNIEFVGQLTDRDLLSYYQNCCALVFPGEEDFGLTSLEAQAMGKPVIAYKEGGLLETIQEGKTGLFFYPHTKEALKKTLEEFKLKTFRADDCCKNIRKFNKSIFKKKFKSFVEDKWNQHQTMILK